MLDEAPRGGLEFADGMGDGLFGVEGCDDDDEEEEEDDPCRVKYVSLFAEPYSSGVTAPGISRRRTRKGFVVSFAGEIVPSSRAEAVRIGEEVPLTLIAPSCADSERVIRPRMCRLPSSRICRPCERVRRASGSLSDIGELEEDESSEKAETESSSIGTR